VTASASADNPAVEALLGSAGRSTLPFQEAERDRNYGTAFWYNHLVEDTAEREVVVQYLITADALTGFDLGTFSVRPELGDPAPSADQIMLTDWRAVWTRLPGLGVAAMPAAGLHAYAEGKGWRWATDEITDGLAARDTDVATIGRRPVEACVLGHGVGVGREREQGVLVGSVVLDRQGRLRWNGRMLDGCAGAPVFVGIPIGNGGYKLVCLGVVLPGEAHNEIASFDRIRREIAALTTPASRRWWKRRPG
jgi:hypothetical protein